MSRLFPILAALSLFACSHPEPRDGHGPPDEHGGPGPGHTPPQEALDACVDHKADDACSFKHDGHELKGKCKAPPNEEKLACLPDGPPPGGPGGHGGPPPGEHGPGEHGGPPPGGPGGPPPGEGPGAPPSK